MFCGICKNDFPGECTCADRDERLALVSKSKHIAMRVCAACNKHADLCKCPDGPSTELRVAR